MADLPAQLGENISRQRVADPQMTRHQVQWAAQFAVGAEVVRRGYSAAFFLGNEPTHDLICAGTREFRVQVKGFSWNKPKRKTTNGNYVLIKDLNAGDKHDIIIIVYVSRSPEPFEFFIAKRGLLQVAQPEIMVKGLSLCVREPYLWWREGLDSVRT
jgi:hypothetical protein